MRRNLLGYRAEVVEDMFGASDALAEVLSDTLGDGGRVLLVADSNVVSHTSWLGQKIGRYFTDNGIRLTGRAVIVPGGEKAKHEDLSGAFAIVDAAARTRVGEGDCILALGGGTAFDLAGWAAAQFGGIPVVRLPTTPAAMTGAAFAENAAIDRCGRKDVVRFESKPAAVLVDVAFLSTVMDGVWRAGAGEIACLAAADDKLRREFVEFAPRYASRDYAAFAEMAARVIELRMKRRDERIAEPLAARLEEMSGFRLPHGYAIPLALLIEMGARTAKGDMSAEAAQEIRAALETCGSLEGLYHSRHLLLRRDDLFAPDMKDREAYVAAVDALLGAKRD